MREAGCTTLTVLIADPLPGRGIALVADGGHGFHLHQLMLITEHAHAEKRAGHFVIGECLADRVPYGSEIVTVCRRNQHSRIRDVQERRTHRSQSDQHVFDALQRLSSEVSDRNDYPIGIERTGAGKVDESGAGADHGRVGLSRVRARESERINVTFATRRT